MSRQLSEDEESCLGCLAGLLVIAIVVAAVMSVAALIDPFAWMPTVHEVWEDCESDADDDSCELAVRFPGFWWHVAANVVYAMAAAVACLAVLAAAADLREKRVARYDDREAWAMFTAARDDFTLAAGATAALAALPILVAAL